jgi:hypothetical protein
MYHVTVYKGKEAVDSRDFEFGTWEEIGFWLDHYGYNQDKYHLLISFS